MASFDFSATYPGWQYVSVDGVRIGGFGQTTRECPSMRWYWTGQGTYGHCETRDEAVAALEALVPAALKLAKADRDARAEFADMPAELQALKSDMDAALVDKQRAWGASSFNEADYLAASQRWFSTRLAFDKAHDAWASRRVAA